jgi:DNA-binding SARP family transcriptional activator
MSEYHLYLLGEVHLEENGAPVAVDTRKALALAAYLVLNGRHLSRDALTAFLWPESDQSSGRGALRRTLSALRKALGEFGLEADRETVYLSGLWVDVIEFRRHLAQVQAHHSTGEAVCASCLEHLENAVSLYRGSFMEGFSLRDSLAFDEWQFQEAEQLRRELGEALILLVDGLLLVNELPQALEFARQWLSLDPLNEAAHRRLMELYFWDGQRSAALRQYRECLRVLDQELGVAPLEETTHVYEAIRKNELDSWNSESDRVSLAIADQLGVQPAPETNAPAFAPSSAGLGNTSIPSQTTPQPEGRLPMVGRQPEMQSLLDIYHSLDGGGRLVVISGEPGIGKTRLAEEFIRHVQSAGGKVLQARAYEGETNLAYGAVIEALRSGLDQAVGSDWTPSVNQFDIQEAARLVPELSAYLRDEISPAIAAGPGAQTRLYEGICRVLLALADGSQPGLLYMDDFHWADEASYDLLAYFVRRLPENPLLIVCTWRREGFGQEERLRSLSSAALRQNIYHQLELQPLDEAQVAELVQAAEEMAGDLPPAWRDGLAAETEGNPFFLVAYLHAWLRGDMPVEAAGHIPENIQTLLRSRLDQLSEISRQVVQSAAVIGRSFDYETLREIAGRSEDETVLALEALEMRGLIRPLVAGEGIPGTVLYDFNHEWMRLLVYQDISLVRQRLLHRRAAESLARRLAGSEWEAFAGQAAYHYRQAGQAAQAAVYYRRAGEYASQIYANGEALNHLEAALALGDPDRRGLFIKIGDLQLLKGNYGASIQSFETVAALSEVGELAPVERRLGQVYERLGGWSQATDHYQAALAAEQDNPDPKLEAQLFADWSLTSHRQGDSEAAAALAQQALSKAEALGDPQVLAQVHNLLGVLARSQDQLEQARLDLEASLRYAKQLDQPFSQAAALNNLALVLGDLGEYERAITLEQEALRLCVVQGDRHREAAVRNNLADMLQGYGEGEAALAELKRAVKIFAEVGVETEIWQPEVWKLVEW